MNAPAMSEDDPHRGLAPELHTWLSLERTLMSWIRTSATMVGLGFTVSKIFDFLHDIQDKARPSHLLGYRTYALVLIGVGTLGLIAGVLQHRLLVRRWLAYASPPYSLATAVAVLFSIFGIAAFMIVLLGY